MEKFLIKELNTYFLESISSTVSNQEYYWRKKALRKKIRVIIKQYKIVIQRPKMNNYIHTIQLFDSKVFHDHFRMTKNSFKVIS